MQKSLIFNRRHVHAQRKRASKRHAQHGFLFNWAANQILERLSDVTRNFKTCIILGSRLPDNFLNDLRKIKGIENLIVADIFQGHVINDHELLPFANQSADLIISILDLHTVNDLPGALIQIKHILKPDGLFLGCILGGETLFELRESLMQSEMKIYGGASPRVAPFADKPQMGDLMQRAGFALPVIDSDILTVSYPTMFSLLADLRGMGESNTLEARKKGFTSSILFASAAEHYQNNFPDEEHRVKASFEIIFMTGWSPHSSQQKPLKPGSAEHRLADLLKTDEHKL